MMEREDWIPDLSTPLPELLTEIRKQVDRVLRIELAERWMGPEPLKAAAIYSVTAGGKRVRPALVVLGAYGCRASPVVEGLRLLKVAASVELIHTYSLIHDDLPCMDDDDTRRGSPTCHMRFDIETATWVGSALLVEGFRLLWDALEGTGFFPGAGSIMGSASGFSGMVGGQWLDIMAEGNTPTMDRVQEIHLMKTAALMAGCGELGSLVSGAGEEERRALFRYGLSVGQAFQVMDDILDVVGDEEIIGKRTRKDIDAGKMTITELLGPKGATNHAESLVKEAVIGLEMVKGPAVHRLADLAWYILHRSS